MRDWLNVKVIGVIFGFVFGLITIIVGLWQAAVVLICALVGWLVVKFWLGEIDFIDAYEEFLRRRGKR